MSLGPGKIQNSILQALQNSDTPIQRNQLLWDLAQKNDKIIDDGKIGKLIPKGSIEDSYKKSFQRAIKSLDGNKIEITKRKLRSIRELIKYYPYKTSSREIRYLREQLFPLIPAYLKEGYVRQKYNINDNEVFLLKKLRAIDPGKMSRYQDLWLNVETEILEILSEENVAEKNLWMSLLIKGRQLFLDDRAKYGLSFHYIIGEMSEQEDKFTKSETDLFKRILNLKSKVFKKDAMKHNRLKSQLHVVAYLYDRTTPRFRDEIKRYFYREKTEVIKDLPDHREPDAKGFALPRLVKFSPLLDKLIDRHAFARFEFLSIK